MALSFANVPSLSSPAERLRALPQAARRRVSDLRHDLYVRREEGKEALFERSADLAERAQAAVEQAPAALAPVMRRVEPALSRGVDALTAPRVDDYDALNVKKVAAAIDGFDVVNLARVRRYEQRNKDRVTVYRAVDRERAQRLAPPTAS